jgi:TPP-dependent pyruvate/acetoin dehydrogenase alpha subunit
MPAGHAPGRHAAGPGSLFVCLCDVAETGGLPVLFFPALAAASAEPFAIGTIEPIDGLDVEAVLAGACRAAQAARSDSRTRLMELDVSGRSDPIEILSVRMRAAHELDDNALRAIDDDAIRLVRAHLTA